MSKTRDDKVSAPEGTRAADLTEDQIIDAERASETPTQPKDRKLYIVNVDVGWKHDGKTYAANDVIELSPEDAAEGLRNGRLVSAENTDVLTPEQVAAIKSFRNERQRSVTEGTTSENPDIRAAQARESGEMARREGSLRPEEAGLPKA